MKKIHTLSLKFWFPASLLAISFCAVLVTAYINGHLGVNQHLTSAQEFVQYDMASLSREIEEAVINDVAQSVDNSLKARSVNTKYRAMFIIHLTDMKIWAQSTDTNVHQNNFALTDQDLKIVDRFKTDTSALVQYDEASETINAYFSVPTQRKNQILIHDGVLIARYYLGAELQTLYGSLIRNNLYFIALFLILIGILQALYYRYIHSPVSHLIKAVERFAKEPEVITHNLTGQSEFTNIGDALHNMSMVILKEGKEKTEAQKEAQNGAHLLESVFKALPDLFFLVDTDMTIADYRASQHKSLYISPEAFLGKPLADVLPPNVSKPALENIAKVRETGDIITFEYDMPRNQEHDVIRHFEARVGQVPHTDKVMVIVRDITEQWESETLIEKQAFYDALTDLPNRYLALDRLNQFILDANRYSHRIAVMFLDLDDFKKINDTLGHNMGDRVLIETANRLTEIIRDTDTIARLGGDEFIILFNNIRQPDDLHQVVEKVVGALERPYLTEGRELLMSASMGIAIYPDDSQTSDDLLRNADMAMYHAKAQGKNQYSFFTKEMNEKIARRLLLEQHMLNAISNHEFEVRFQPQFHLAEQKLIGAEALLRWNSPELGYVSPTEFIPIAEQNGRIISLGYFVIEEAVKQCARWQSDLHGHFRVAINLSPRQMRDTDILSFVEHQLAANRLSGEHLEFEITEGVLLSGQASVREILSGFHALGITLSMDDFGTGYSSLSYLQEYPFDMVKIDRSFISNIVESDHSRSLVNAIVSMTHNLKLSVLAEGVETLQQAAILQAFGCDLIQGFLMGQALSPEQFNQQWSDPEYPKSLMTMQPPEERHSQ